MWFTTLLDCGLQLTPSQISSPYKAIMNKSSPENLKYYENGKYEILVK